MKLIPLFRPAALTLALAAAMSGCSSIRVDADRAQSAAFTAAVIGDTPYGTSPTDTRQLKLNPKFIAAINADQNVSLVTNAGDIHAGKQYCTQEYDQATFGQWRAFKQPLVYSIGDNERIDCHKAKEGGGKYNKATGNIDDVQDASGKPSDDAKGDPMANLDLVRSIFFAAPGQTLGGAMQVHIQAQEFDPRHPADKAFVEDVWWEQAGVLFVTVNIPGGSNNGVDLRYGALAMSAVQLQEVTLRRDTALD